MRDSKTNKPEDKGNDLFYDYFKDSLQDHQMPVEDQSWDIISSGINPRKKKGMWITLFSGAAAAVILLFILFGIGLINKNTETELSENLINKVETGSDNKQSQPINNDSKTESKLISQINETSQSDAGLQSDKYIAQIREKADMLSKMKHKGNVEKNVAISSSNDSVVANNKEAETLYTAVSNENSEVNNISADSIKKAARHYESGEINKKYDDLLLAYEPKNNNKWAISAEMGVNKLRSESHNYYGRIMLSESAIINPDNLLMGINSDPEVVEYAPPVSVGIMARKRINSMLGFETGLVYSYLSTSFADMNNHHYSANLTLHYLGVPVNVIADIFNVKDILKVYASVGPMIEKGVKSEFNERNNIIRQSAKDVGVINGIQLSANASLGLSYKFYDNWNFYLEPKISYYFDNNQPTSIRTEKRTIIGINSGFRYDF
jgi:hypothetical protein